MPRLRPQRGFGRHPDRRPAVVAGASTGIGAATAVELAHAGYPVALGARRGDLCRELAEKITGDGGDAVGLDLDVADTESVTRFAAAVTERLGEVDVVVANAGLMTPGLLSDTDPDELARVLEVNTVGLQRLVRAFLPGMLARRHGDLVLVSSDVVDTPRPMLGPYVASKWAAEGLARTLQMELEGTGVRCSIVRPGPTATDISAGWETDDAMKIVEFGTKFGSLRHFGYQPAASVARTVRHVVDTPPGTHVLLSHVAPEAPLVTEDRR